LNGTVIEYHGNFTINLQDKIVKCIRDKIVTTKVIFESTNKGEMTVNLFLNKSWINSSLIERLTQDIEQKTEWIIKLWDFYPTSYLRIDKLDRLWFHLRPHSHEEKLYRTLRRERKMIIESFFRIRFNKEPQADYGYFLKCVEIYNKYGFDTDLWDSQSKRIGSTLIELFTDTREYLAKR
jgi:hypothetical protein